jgi:uncharacterized protein (DUF736 family)
MIKESLIQEFQKNNKESDIMGVIRTLYPNIEVSIPSKKKGKKK